MRAPLARGSGITKSRVDPSLYLDALNLLYCRFLDRANSIDRIKHSKDFIELSNVAFEDRVRSPAFGQVQAMGRTYDLLNPVLTGNSLRDAAKAVFVR